MLGKANEIKSEVVNIQQQFKFSWDCYFRNLELGLKCAE